MAKYRVQSIEERADGQIACDTFVYVEREDGGVPMDVQIGHFTVMLRAADVAAVKDLPKPQRIAHYKALFYADPRIQGVTDSEDAVAQMEADVSFPVTVAF